MWGAGTGTRVGTQGRKQEALSSTPWARIGQSPSDMQISWGLGWEGPGILVWALWHCWSLLGLH